jgi:small subunit ribosomal protein S30e
MQVFLQAEALHSITVNESTTVGDLKEAISVAESVPCEEQVVLYGGVPLEETVAVCGTVPPEATLTVTVRVPGGKAHGSLARAGKVRGQTPKVDKQEKKKAKTGRAKRRMQYNRRFVNTVVTFGRKKGPNSNS